MVCRSWWPPRAGSWAWWCVLKLDDLERFPRVKLGQPGYEHCNLPRALAEFGLRA
jgi:hypothetical protein